jgi:hypothetical protein
MFTTGSSTKPPGVHERPQRTVSTLTSPKEQKIFVSPLSQLARSIDHLNLHLSPPLSTLNKKGRKEERKLDWDLQEITHHH